LISDSPAITRRLVRGMTLLILELLNILIQRFQEEREREWIAPREVGGSGKKIVRMAA
jgi:hypothetical protein